LLGRLLAGTAGQVTTRFGIINRAGGSSALLDTTVDVVAEVTVWVKADEVLPLKLLSPL
jgi:hypothetical protein